MPLSQAQKTELQASVQTVAEQVEALVVDTVDVAALQAQLDQALADLVVANGTIAELQAKISAALAALA